VHFNKDGPG